MSEIFEEAGCTVVPLFNGLKFPCYPGYRGERPLEAAKTWIVKTRENGVNPVLSGRYALLTGWGVVIDCEGRKWNGSEASKELPAWLSVVQSVASDGLLPSWVSAGGDGGRGIRNVLIPFAYERVCAAINVDVNAGKVHRVPIGEEGKAELLLKSGVCIPKSQVGSAVVDWVSEDGARPGLIDACEAARPIMNDLCEVLRAAVVDAKEAGVKSGYGGDELGDAPLVKSIEVALWSGGANAGLEATREALDDGGSRHYACKTWANWALLYLGAALLKQTTSGDDYARVLEVISDKIWKSWARAVGFAPGDVMKAVREEAKFLKWGQHSGAGLGDWR